MDQPLDSTWISKQSSGEESQPRSFRSFAARRTSELFDEFHPGVLRYLTGITHNRAEAEDLLQEAFLRLYRELEAGGSIRDPRAWLFTVSHRLAVDLFRRRESSGAHEGEILDRGPDPEAAALKRERNEWLANAIAALSPQQRHCLSLRAEGLQYKEIASILGVQISTVRTMIVRAVARLSGGFR